MRILLRLFTLLVVSSFAINGLSTTPTTNISLGGEGSIGGFRGAFTPVTNSLDKLSTHASPVAMYGTASHIMAGPNNVPMAARSIISGTTVDDYDAEMARRRVIGDSSFRPDYDPNDPFHTPVGDIPWLLFVVLSLFYIARRTRRNLRPAEAPNSTSAK